MNLNGIHHVTAITARIADNLDFYTNGLGLRLVKKSVNQDDLSAYHLFYADKIGSPGTDMTFFDWPETRVNQRGSDSISTTVFRVNGRRALEFWKSRLDRLAGDRQDIEEFGARSVMRFEDPEGQRLMLMDDGGAEFEGEIWPSEGIPTEFALRGFYGVLLSVPSIESVDPILSEILQFEREETTWTLDGQEFQIYKMGQGGPGKEVWVAADPDSPIARLGAGGVHHVAFRVADDSEQRYWRDRVESSGLHISPFIDRYYFRSIYFRISNGILFEIATDGPGFAADEDPERLGETLALPPFLEPQRAQIEAGLRPIEVVSEA
jgi:glyoxalase family protein